MDNHVDAKRRLALERLDAGQLLAELRTSRQLSVQVAQRGAELHDLVAREVELRVSTFARPLPCFIHP